MERVVFSVSSVKDSRMELIEFPELTSDHHWVKHAIDFCRQKMPRLLKHISMQRALAKLDQFLIVFRCENLVMKEARLLLNNWLQREINKRFCYMILEALILPVGAILFILPGPNVFFIIPATLLYFHFKSFRTFKRMLIHCPPLEVEAILNS